MGKELLQQYTDLKKEIKDLEKKINKLEKNLAMTAHASVRGSSNTYPYTERTFHVEGHDIGATTRREKILREQKMMLELRYDELLETQTRIEKWINTIPDSRIRRIFTYRYIEDLNWIQVAYRMGGRNTADAYRKEHDKFLKEN